MRSPSAGTLGSHAPSSSVLGIHSREAVELGQGPPECFLWLLASFTL